MPQSCTPQRFLHLPTVTLRVRTIRSSVTLALASFIGSVLLGWMQGAIAQAPVVESAPDEITTALAQIDAAANQRNIEGVMGFFSRDFSHADGLTHDSFEDALTHFWERFPQLNYQTVLDSWLQEGTAIVAETTTTITGRQSVSGRDLTLTATLKSRQRFENGQIVHQEILSEQSRLSTGEGAPTVDVMLPTEVVIGRPFAFDAIVQEPLGEQLLLGAALEEPVQVSHYLDQETLQLELLSSGGLFKVGRAPALPDDRWISAVIIRESGIVAETRRLRVVGR